MISSRFVALAVVAAFPFSLLAQVRPVYPVYAPPPSLVIKSVKVSDVTAAPGTVITGTTGIGGMICCIMAKTTSGSSPSMVVHFGDGSVHSPALQTGLRIQHDVAHSLTIMLNGTDIFSVQCDGKGSLKASADFAALGASSGGYKWELSENGKAVTSGHGSGGGEGIVIDMGHDVSDMQFGITDRGVMTLYHGSHTLVITPDATNIGAKTGGYLRFQDLGVRAGGVSEFSLVSPALVSSVQPPGSR